MFVRHILPLQIITKELNAYDYVTYGVGILDIIVFIAAAIQLYRFAKEERQALSESRSINSAGIKQKFNGKILFHQIIMCAMIVQGTYLLIFSAYIHHQLSWPKDVLTQSIIDNSLKQLGSVFFLLAYFMLLLFWADFYYRANNSRKHVFLNARGLLIFLLVILPLFCAVSCIVQVKTITRFYISERVDDTISFVLSVLSLLVAIGFLYYGLKLYFVLRRYRLLSTRKASQTRKVVGVAVMASVCFVGRASLYIWSVVLSWQHPQQQFNVSWEVCLVFYFLLETVPVSLMLYLLRLRKVSKPTLDSPHSDT